MCRFIFILLILIPAVELGLLIKVGGYIGSLQTIGLVVLTAAIGLRVFGWQGASMPMRLQRGEIEPTDAVLEGTILSIGAIALLIPGFVTDVLGALCLIPPLRRLVARRFSRRLSANFVEVTPNSETIIVVRPKGEAPPEPPPGELPP